MANCVYRLRGLAAIHPSFQTRLLQAAGNALLALDHSQSLQPNRYVQVNAAGIDRPAGDVLHRGPHPGHRFFLSSLYLDGGGKFLGKVTAPQAVPLGVQIQHPNITHPFAAQGVLADRVGGELWHHPALEYFLNVRTIIGHVIFHIYGYLAGAIE